MSTVPHTTKENGFHTDDCAGCRADGDEVQARSLGIGVEDFSKLRHEAEQRANEPPEHGPSEEPNFTMAEDNADFEEPPHIPNDGSAGEAQAAFQQTGIEDLSLYATAFRPGDVLVIECEREFTVDMHDKLTKVLSESAKATGIKFVILAAGMRVARLAKREEPEQIDLPIVGMGDAREITSKHNAFIENLDNCIQLTRRAAQEKAEHPAHVLNEESALFAAARRQIATVCELHADELLAVQRLQTQLKEVMRMSEERPFEEYHIHTMRQRVHSNIANMIAIAKHMAREDSTVRLTRYGLDLSENRAQILQTFELLASYAAPSVSEDEAIALQQYREFTQALSDFEKIVADPTNGRLHQSRTEHIAEARNAVLRRFITKTQTVGATQDEGEHT